MYFTLDQKGVLYCGSTGIASVLSFTRFLTSIIPVYFETDPHKGRFTRCDLYHTILLDYYAKIKKIIHESMTLKGVVYT